MRKILLIISICIFINTIAKAQEEDPLSNKKHFAFEFSSGMNYKVFINEDNNTSISNKFKVNPINLRMFYFFKKNWDLSLGFSHQKVLAINTWYYYNIIMNISLKATFINQLNFGIDYYPLNLNKFRLGFSLNAGHFVSDFTMGAAFNFGTYGLYKLSKNFDVFINPVYGRNIITTSSYKSITKIFSDIFSINAGLRYNMNYLKNENQNLKNFGFDLGLNIYTFKKVEDVYDLNTPIYKNAFYFRSYFYPTFNLIYSTKNNNIHTIELGYNNYNELEPNSGKIFNMGVQITDYIFAYKYNYLISEKVLNLKEYTQYFIGLKLFWDNKYYSIHDNPPFYGLPSRYILDIQNKSNLLLIQLSPSVKNQYRKFFIDFGLNFNVVGFNFGKLFYDKHKEIGEAPTIIENLGYYNDTYYKFITPINLFSDWFFVHNLSIKVGFMF